MKYVLLFLACLPAAAATWYASPAGSETNGTYAQPWSMWMAFGTNATNPYLTNGDTVIFKDGTYDIPLPGASNHIYPLISGVSYRSENLWAAKFEGAIHIPVTTSNLVLWGLNVFNSYTTNRNMTNDWVPYSGGITEYGRGSKLLHNLVENGSHPGIGSWKTTQGKYIAGNVVRFMGVNTYGDTGYPDGTDVGSGFYLQNLSNSATATIQGNISYWNHTTGMKAYGNTDIWGFRFLENAIYSCPEAGVFFHLDNHGSDGVTISSNYMWDAYFRLGYPLGNGGHSNAVAAGNYVVYEGSGANTPLYVADGWRNISFTNNTAVNTGTRYVWNFEVAGETSGDLTSHTIDRNVYLSTNYGGFGANQFATNEARIAFDTWRGTVRGDTNSTFAYAWPTTNHVAVFQPSEDSNFVHVIVYNWAEDTSLTTNLSAWFLSGDALRIYDAQDIPTAYTNFTYSGGEVVLDLSRTNRATMNGSRFSDSSEDWSGFDPRFRAFVVHRFALGYPARAGMSGQVRQIGNVVIQ